jgi:chloramphenicol-sensitive protein RarD
MGFSAFLLWGAFPLYFRMLHRIPALELVAHRAVWSMAALALGTIAARKGATFVRQISSGRILSFHFLTSLLIAANWLLYVWGVNAGRVVECSLGYFLNPLVSVALGVVVLRERLRPAQWAGVALAATGVVYLATRAGSFPWLSISLALSFGLYGLLKKRAPLGSFEGLFVETLLLAPFAIGWIVWSERSPTGPMQQATSMEWALVVGTGIVTTVPLLLFSSATRRIPLSWMGFMQYITPTIQLLIGVLVFKEAFGPERMHGFALVWAGLGVVMIDGIRHMVGRTRNN